MTSLNIYSKEQTDSLLDEKANANELSAVATSGSYDDLTDKPSIPSAPVQSNWNETDTTSLAYIQNKPTIPAGSVVDSALSDTSENAVQNKVITNALADKVDTSSLATVATSGSYDDLTDKPSIPSAPVQSNWNETDTTSLAYIQNKPTIPSAVTVDSALDSDSTNPVQNAVVTDALNDKMDDVDTSGASGGDVLSLDSNLEPVWSTPSSGGLTRTITNITNATELLNAASDIQVGDQILFTNFGLNSYSCLGSFTCCIDNSNEKSFAGGGLNIPNSRFVYLVRIDIGSNIGSSSIKYYEIDSYNSSQKLNTFSLSNITLWTDFKIIKYR